MDLNLLVYLNRLNPSIKAAVFNKKFYSCVLRSQLSLLFLTAEGRFCLGFLFCLFDTGSYYVVQAGLKLTM